MHCFNESAPLANIFDCMKGHNRKLNRLRGESECHGGSGAVKMRDRFFFFFSTCSPSSCKQIGAVVVVRGWGLVLTPPGSRRYTVTVPRLPMPFSLSCSFFFFFLPSIHLCIIGPGK